MLIDIRYKSEKIDIPFNDIAAKCSILMPTDAKRNQMNASSNFEIINSILLAVRKGDKVKFHSPGVFVEILELNDDILLIDGDVEHLILQKEQQLIIGRKLPEWAENGIAR